MVHTKHFKTLVDHPLSIIPAMDVAHIPNLDAEKIISGIFNVLRIPNLDAGKITSGILNLTRIPLITPAKMDAVDSPSDDEALTYDAVTGKFEWSEVAKKGITDLSELKIDVSKDWLGFIIKNLGAPVDLGDVYSKGNLIDVDDIPSLDASKITSGVFDLTQIPSIPPSKLDAIDSPADGEVPTYNEEEEKFEWKVAAGVTNLSDLVIDVDKDWATKIIKNLGAPVEAGDVYSVGNEIDIDDIPTITYDKLSIANSVLVSDILSTEFNVANKFLKLDASALVPLNQIPATLTNKDADTVDTKHAADLINVPAESARGDILFRNATAWTRLEAGTSGKFLKTLGAAADPLWDTVTALDPTKVAGQASGLREEHAKTSWSGQSGTPKLLTFSFAAAFVAAPAVVASAGQTSDKALGFYSGDEQPAAGSVATSTTTNFQVWIGTDACNYMGWIAIGS